MLTAISMFSPCIQWVFGPLSPVLINKVVVILLLATKSESKKQWVESESIKVFTGIDWLVFGIQAERDNTSEEETEAAERRKTVRAGGETGGEMERSDQSKGRPWMSWLQLVC